MTPTTAADILPVLAAGGAGVLAFFAPGTYGLVSPASSMWGPVLWHGDAASHRVAITFDDGPLPGVTDRILDSLAESDAKAAFFVIGRNAQCWPDLVRRAHDEGHLICNHTFAHSHTALFGRHAGWFAELTRADDVIAQIIGVRPAIFRPPMGYKHWHLMNAAADSGHRVVTWSRRARDARGASASEIVSRLAEPAKAGDVLVLHDGDDPHLPPRDRSGTRDCIRPLINRLRQRGLAPVRLDDLLQIPAYQPTTRANPVLQPA